MMAGPLTRSFRGTNVTSSMRTISNSSDPGGFSISSSMSSTSSSCWRRNCGASTNTLPPEPGRDLLVQTVRERFDDARVLRDRGPLRDGSAGPPDQFARQARHRDQAFAGFQAAAHGFVLDVGRPPHRPLRGHRNPSAHRVVPFAGFGFDRPLRARQQAFLDVFARHASAGERLRERERHRRLRRVEVVGNFRQAEGPVDHDVLFAFFASLDHDGRGGAQDQAAGVFFELVGRVDVGVPGRRRPGLMRWSTK